MRREVANFRRDLEMLKQNQMEIIELKHTISYLKKTVKKRDFKGTSLNQKEKDRGTERTNRKQTRW